MLILSEKGGSISRTFNPGIWVWFSQCDNKKTCSIKLGRVQIDNQLQSIELPTRVVFAAKEVSHGDVKEGTKLSLHTFLNTFMLFEWFGRLCCIEILI